MSNSQSITGLIYQADWLIENKVDCISPEFEQWKINVERALANRYGQHSYELKKFLEISL